MFVYIHADWRKSDSSVDGQPRGNGRRNSNSRDLVARSPSFSRPAATAHRIARAQATSDEKKQLLAVSDITITVAPLAHRWQRRKKTNCLLHFRVLNLKDFSMNPAMMGSQEHNDEHVKQLSSDFHLWLLEPFSLFENGRAFIIEDDSKNIYFCWLSCCKPSYL